ncbi:MAG: HAD hydrolase family protein, partial [Ilumatobacter sp.]
AVLAALAHARRCGLAVVLATGRILDELVADFPDVGDHFDALVVENGAHVRIGDRDVTPLAPVDPRLADQLASKAIKHRRGRVIIACSVADEHAIVDVIAALGLECQLTRNRAELMIVPSGVNKGVGLRVALGELGISHHDCVAVGDAENDHSLLAAAELGVAVANAVGSLLSDADVVLETANGAGIVELLDDLTTDALVWHRRRRPQLDLGCDAHGAVVSIPAHPANIIISGGSGDGKSYLAGLIAEQLIELGYSVMVIDPEGDHIGLDTLRSATVVGDDGPPPAPDTVVAMLKRSDACVVVDLSAFDHAERFRYLGGLPAAIEAARRTHGRPHWVFIDEAHRTITPSSATLGTIDLSASGYCLVTWRPDELAAPLIAGTDIVLALTAADPDPSTVDLVAAVSGYARRDIAEQLTGPTGSVVVAVRNQPHPPPTARLAARHTNHFRHEHKYDVDGTPPHRGFWMRSDQGAPTGAVAHNLHELEVELSRCERDVVRHHALRGDFSRWIDDVFHLRDIAADIAAIEATVDDRSAAAAIDIARLELISSLHRRHHHHTT